MGNAYPEQPAAESLIQDESGREFIRLGIGVHKDVIVEIGFRSDPELPEGVPAAMRAMLALAKDKAIMAASLIRAADIAKGLDAAEPETPKYAAIAELMLHECLRNYSMNYNKARAERLKKRDAGQQE